MKNLISKVFTKRLFRRNRRFMSIMTMAILGIATMSGCGSTNESTKVSEGKIAETDDETISVVTTIFPEYDWVREIVDTSTNVETTLLLDNGVDLHNYQPTAEDIVKISTCDLFIYVGGESDEWVEDALAEATNEDMKVINLLDVMGDKVKEEEVVEGMEVEEEEEEAEEEGPEYDEHVWLSLNNAEIFVNEIATTLEQINPDDAELYSNNANNYIEKIRELNDKYESIVNDASFDTLIFGDRFPFRYMVDDYGLNYYAAFVGCSAETEASFETIMFLAGKVDELQVNSVLTIENSDQKIAKTIIENSQNSDANILSMDSMQSTTSDDVAAGKTYLSIMEANAEVLSEALN